MFIIEFENDRRSLLENDFLWKNAFKSSEEHFNAASDLPPESL